MKYDPQSQMDPEAWALDETERIGCVSEYHRRQKIHNPDDTIQVIVKNQVALGDKYPARFVLSRLISEGLDRQGLDRHEAVHAIGSVLAEQLLTRLSTRAVRPTLIRNTWRS